VKTFFLSVVLVGLTFCANAQLSTNQPSRFKTKVISYEGKIGSGVNGSTTNFVPVNTGAGGSDTVTSPGHESELKWTFVGRNGDKDVYWFTFTRTTTKTPSPGRTTKDKITTAKEVQFDGKQIVVFKDELHLVVMESPSAEDLKTAQGH
jgi:hypothetical protein